MQTATRQRSELDLDALGAMFETADPARIVEWTISQFSIDRVVMSSSFGAESAVLLHLTTRIAPRIKVIFVNTGYLFPETHAHVEALRKQLDLNIWTYRTRNDPIAYLHQASEENPKWRKDIESCCAANKIEPFDRAMAELKPSAWFRGIRRDQSESRRDAKFIHWHVRHACYAVSPLLNMGPRQIHAYLKKHDLPYNPLFDKGYASIGCNPLSCTRPIQIGEEPRDGRWAGADKIECGINVDRNSLDSAQI